jgi:L-asparaginase / beta-aspartyl-peptidase
MSRLLNAFLASISPCAAQAALAQERGIAIVIHGGAGVISRANMTPEREAGYRAGLEAARDAGYAILERGGSSPRLPAARWARSRPIVTEIWQPRRPRAA